MLLPMAVYIDPPLWPAHGTVFSHLISDTSLDELHAVAAEAGIPERAFDRHLVTLGAREVDGGTLVRVLIASGLRVPARRRPARIRQSLRTRWEQTLPGAQRLGSELLDRWSEPHRRYHTPEHLLDVLEALDLLFTENDDAGTRLHVRLAAWFHDAVYAGRAGEDEEASAALAGASLARFCERPTEVRRLVLLTASHAPEHGDRAGELLCDADLAVLGRPPGGYRRYVAAVREEYAHVPDGDFVRGRADVVDRLLALDPLYRTAEGQRLWADRARQNLESELAALR
jgi:predicted metal-dependent HD superfamily phosphohydrolase